MDDSDTGEAVLAVVIHILGMILWIGGDFSWGNPRFGYDSMDKRYWEWMTEGKMAGV